MGLLPINYLLNSKWQIRWVHTQNIGLGFESAIGLTSIFYSAKGKSDRITRWHHFTSREDVRGVGGIALATPFFQDLFYMPSRLLAIWSSGHPVIRTSGHPTIWSSDHSVIPTIRPSDYLVIQTSDHQVIQPSGTSRSSDHPVFWPSVSMPQKCPYWDIFGIPYCRLHQSQIPNVLPDDSSMVLGGSLFSLHSKLQSES